MSAPSLSKQRRWGGWTTELLPSLLSLQTVTVTRRSAPSWRTSFQGRAAPKTSCSTTAKLWVVSTRKASASSPQTTTLTRCGPSAVTWWLSTSKQQVQQCSFITRRRTKETVLRDLYLFFYDKKTFKWSKVQKHAKIFVTEYTYKFRINLRL